MSRWPAGAYLSPPDATNVVNVAPAAKHSPRIDVPLPGSIPYQPEDRRNAQ